MDVTVGVPADLGTLVDCDTGGLAASFMFIKGCSCSCKEMTFLDSRLSVSLNFDESV